MPRYELSEGTSNKFWEIELNGDSFTTTYGRIGTAGQSTTKAFATPEKAKAEHDKLVAEKVRKGYRLVAGASSPVRAPAPAPAAPAPAEAAAPLVRASSPSPFGTRDDLVRRVRQRRILAAFYPLQEQEFEGSAAGDSTAGHYEAHDGSGNFFLVYWDASGVVALAYNHDGPEGEWDTPRQKRDPGRHLPDVPRAMRALAARAADHGERLATEGFWLTAGPEPAFGSGEQLDILDQLKGDETGDVWMAGADRYGALAARMASKEPYELTADDERELLGSSADRETPLEAEHVARAAKALAKLGVVWRDAVLHAQPTIEAQRRALEARMARPDTALLHAAYAGDLEAVKDALARGANIDVPASKQHLGAVPEWHVPDGMTPLLLALRERKHAVVDHLFDAGADLDAEHQAWGGPMSALRLAASQGDVELTQRLIDKGASAAHLRTPRTLHQLSSDIAPSNTPPACVDVLRMLLDVGAPLPDDTRCQYLARFAARHGAADLVPRLTRVYAEDVLPVVPPLAPPDPEAISLALERAASALAKSQERGRDDIDVANDRRAAYDALIEAWRASHHPRIGDAAEAFASHPLFGSQAGVPALQYFSGTPQKPVLDEAAVSALQAACKARPDPRAARAVLPGPTMHLTSGMPAARARCADAIAALLVHLRDVRYLESLEQMCGTRAGSHSTVRPSMQVALAAMKEVQPSALSEADVQRLGAIEDVIADRKPRAPGTNGPTTRDLFQAVYDHPDDDAPRRALAERLVEAGDPRGEFIRLQLERSDSGGKVTRREKQLLKEHGKRWVGDLAAVLADDFVFERGFLVEAASGEGWSGPGSGHVSNVLVLPTGGGTQLEWSTVRRLSLWRHNHPGNLLGGSRIRGLRELVDISGPGVLTLGHGAARPLERLEITPADHASDAFNEIVGSIEALLPDKLPALTHLRMPAPGGSIERAHRLVERLPKLRELSLGLGAPRLAEIAALAIERRLAKVRSLGKVDYAFAPESGALEISFPDGFDGSWAAPIAELIRSADIPLRRVVVLRPPRATADAHDGAPPVLKLRTKSMDLGPIYAAAESRGAPCSIEAEEITWAQRLR